VWFFIKIQNQKALFVNLTQLFLITLFYIEYTKSKADLTSLQLWWDVGKSSNCLNSALGMSQKTEPGQ
jgi:hypothetical protein